MNIYKKTALAAAITAAVGTPATAAVDCTAPVGTGKILTGDWTGVLTLIDPGGTPAPNSDSPDGAPWYQKRTPVSGTMTFGIEYDGSVADTGSGTLVPFAMFGGGTAQFTTISFQAIGDGFGGPGNLVLGNMGFDWAGSNGIPISLVLDATGFYGAGDDCYTASETITGGAIPASSDYAFRHGATTYTLPIGPSPLATTTWNTTTIGGAGCTLGCNPSGTLPLIADTIGGSPMLAGPFPGWNMNFDFTSIHVGIMQTAPIPAAVWLFGSGLLGLIGIARRKAAR